MKDILFSQARKAHYDKPAINETIVAMHKAWSPLDYVFYDYFAEIMDKTISEQVDDFQQEVALFDKYMDMTLDFCEDVCVQMGNLVKKQASQEELMSVLQLYNVYDQSQWDSGFNVTGLDCLMMKFDPNVYRNAYKVMLFPEQCTVKRDNSINYDERYCHDHFSYSFPWEILRRPQFVSECYTK